MAITRRDFVVYERNHGYATIVEHAELRLSGPVITRDSRRGIPAHIPEPRRGRSALVVWLPIVIAAIAAMAAVGGLVRDYRPPKYRMSWRVHLDNRVGLTPKGELAGVAKLGVLYRKDGGGLVDMPEAAVVLLRVRVDGREAIPAGQFTERVTFRFGTREVIGVQVKHVGNNDPDTDPFLDEFLGPKPPGQDSRAPENENQQVLDFPKGECLRLPKMAYRRDTHIRMLVLLKGGKEKVVTAEGGITGGEIVEDTARLGVPSKTTTGTLALAVGAAFLALIVAVFLIIHRPTPPIPGIQCVSGSVSVSGSTAFEPTTQGLAARYHASCPDSQFSSEANGSFGGVLQLAIKGRGDPSVRNTSLASSDGPVAGFEGVLSRRPMAVVIFSVVANTADGVYSLTRDDLAGIYAGRITNWKELHGPDLPIRIVSRGTDSGTRATFDQKLLRNRPEPAANSHNCVDPDPALPASPTIRCEIQTTEEVLQQVNAIPGAIGYAEMSATSTSQPTSYPQLHQIQIGGYDPSPASVKNGGYPFWTVEYLYSYGQPDTSSLAAAFLNFMDTDTAKNIMQQQGHIPCTDPDAQQNRLCQ